MIVKQILQAIAFCHDCKIVHRDLKPENVLVDKECDNILKIIDFGTSCVFTDTPMTEMHGTSYYIAPEILSNHYDERCDVWSIGVILYILLSGRPPFDGDDDQEIT
jgi:calcium-dependent protein kinase